MSKVDCPSIKPAVGVYLSCRAYWILSLLLVVGYLAFWLINFPYVYGCLIDDWMCYVKGLHTVEDPKAAFATGTNALQPYFFLYSYLPIWSDISVPSYELPMYGSHTGNVRFFLLYTILFHGLIALSWVWFAERIAGSRTAALLSTALFLTSEEFVLWTPLPETRLIGLPLALLGIWLLIRPVQAGFPTWRSRVGWLFAAGSAFGLAQSLHYTALYLIVPMSVAVWLWELRAGWRHGGWWLGWAAFAVGCAWLQGLLELVSHYWVGLPWICGPTASLWKLNRSNMSPCPLWVGGMYLGKQWVTIIGLPLMLAALLGVWVWLGKAPSAGPWERNRRAALAAGTLLGIGLIFVLPTIPVFRKFALLLPLVFLWAAWGIVWVARLAAQRPIMRGIVALGLLVLVDLIPLRQSAQVVRAHLGLGRVIHWAEQHRAGNDVRWMVARRPLIYTPDDLRRDDPDNYVITCLPRALLDTWPSLAYPLYAAEPLYSEPHFLAIQSIYGGLRMRKDMRSRRLCVLSDVRVYRVGDLARHLRCRRTLRLLDLRTDSTAGPSVEPANLFDRDASPDHVTYWASQNTAGPHRIQLDFEQTAELDSVAVVLSLHLSGTPRLEKIHVCVSGEDAPLRTVWMGSGLQEQQVIIARFPRQPVRRMELRLWSFGDMFQPGHQVRIEELIFPGCRVEGPRPRRKFPPLVLKRVERQGRYLVAYGENITPYTRLRVDGRSLEPDFSQYNAETLLSTGYYPHPDDVLRVRWPEDGSLFSDRVTVALEDDFRHSNPLKVRLPGGTASGYKSQPTSTPTAPGELPEWR